VRRVRNRVAATLLALVLLAATSGTAGAAGPLPTGESQGVRITWKHGGAMVVVFGKRSNGLYRRIAGRKVTVSCWHLSPHGVSDGGGVTFRAPKRGRVLKTGDVVRDWDYCRVWRASYVRRGNNTRIHHSREPIVAIPLTQRGAVYLDEHARAYGLFVLLVIADGDGPPSQGPFDPAQQVIDRTGGFLRFVPGIWPGRHRLVALTAPDQTPPAGALGYFNGGPEHAAAVVLSASGRRLFLERMPNDVLHTNVSRYVFGDQPG
jgi:hypothetical protein